MRPDHQEIVEGVKLVAVAAVSAVLAATAVIGASRVLLHGPATAAAAQPPALVRVIAR